MRLLLKIWLALLIGGVLAVLVNRDSGYLLVSYDVWSIELSLVLAILLLAALFALLYMALRLLARASRLPAEARAWRQQGGSRIARRALTQGLLDMSEGNWSLAEKQLVRYADRSDAPLLNYLIAARAAQLQGAQGRRDRYIRLAHESTPSADLAVSLTQAELELADNQLEQALGTLRHLRRLAPRHTYVLRQLRRLYEQLDDWDELKALIPELRRRSVEPEADLRELEVRVHRSLLERASLSVEPTRVREVWGELPRELRHDERLVGDYAHYLLERDKDDEAEALLRAALQKRVSNGLLETYGLLDTGQPAKQISFAESLLEDLPENPALLLALGRLCLRARLWGKARGYLEASIGAGGPVAAYRELGHLLEQMGEPDTALEVYRRGLSGAGGPEPIPLPKHAGQTSVNQPMPHAPREVVPPPPHGARPSVEPG